MTLTAIRPEAAPLAADPTRMEIFLIATPGLEQPLAEETRALGYDARFVRMWDFYLASCAGAFQGGNCDVTQITVTRPS